MTIERPMLPPGDSNRRRFLSQAAGIATGGTVMALAAIPARVGRGLAYGLG
jgi:hypothetical protein